MYDRYVHCKWGYHPKKRSEKDLWAAQRNQENWNDYFEAEPFRSTRILLGLYGGMPFTWKKPHKPSLHPLESTVMYSCTIFIIILVFEYYFLKSERHMMLYDTMPLSDYIMHVQLQIFSSYLLVNVASWMDVSSSRRTLDTWVQLRKLYQKITGRRFTQRRRTLEKLLNSFVVIFPFVAFGFSDIAIPQAKVTWNYYPVIVQPGTVFMIICFLWITYFNSLKTMANDINDDFKRDLNNNTMTLKKLHDYRKAWLGMRTIVDCASSLNAPFLIFLLSVTLIIIISYELIVLYQSGNNVAGMAFTQLVITLVGFVHYMANLSSEAADQVKMFYDTILANGRLQSMSDTEQGEVVGLYLTEKSRRLSPSYGGFVTVNRALVLTVIAGVATHLVILMQFAQSVDDTETVTNITKNTTV